MENILIVALTLIAYWAILKVIKKRSNKVFSKTLYRQSDMHRMLKYFFSLEITNNKKHPSQLTKRREKSMIKVIVMENQAYWVSDNTFYVAKAFEGEVLPDTAKPVDIENMSRKDIDRMLFILDNLKNGKDNDDSSSAGDKRF
jgi:hypothetical protein